MEIQWSLVLFTALTGMGGMLLFMIGLNALLGKTEKGAFSGSVASIVLLVVGGLASVTHLSHPDRMLGALQHPTSGIFTEAVLVGLCVVCAAVFALMVKRSAAGGALKAVAVIGMVLGVLMAFMSGQSYIMAALDAWNTELLPLGYFGTALAEGAAAYLVLLAVEKAEKEALSLYGLVLLVAGVASTVTVVAYGAVSGAFGAECGTMYVVGALLCGGIVPAICGAIAWKKPESALVLEILAVATSLAGAIAFRCAMWLLGTSFYGFFNLL